MKKLRHCHPMYSGQTVGWIKMKLGTEVGLGPGHIVLDGNPAPSPHVCCGQTAGWIKMPLGTEVDLGPDDIMSDVDPSAPAKKRGGQEPPLFGPCIVAKRIDGSRCYRNRK